MIGFIHEHYMEKITLSDIAKSGYVSKRNCGTIFWKYQNKTPFEFLTDYRLRKSIELMSNSELTILTIALSVGFRAQAIMPKFSKNTLGSALQNTERRNKPYNSLKFQIK